VEKPSTSESDLTSLNDAASSPSLQQGENTLKPDELHSGTAPQSSPRSELSKRPERTDSPDSEKMMTIVEHLDELRTRLVRCLVYTAVGVMVGLVVCKPVLRFLEAPAGGITFQALSLEEPIVVYCKVSFYLGLIFASPMILFEASRFVGPGLTRRERQIMLPVLVGSPILFVCGTAFAYFLLLPSMLHFFAVFGQGVTPINQRLDFYVSLVSSILLYMGLCFQLPIVIFALSFTGIIGSKMLLSYWKYAVFAAAVIAAIITPDPTAFSMLLVMGALTTLYFISIALLKLFGR
jgi:sec-independent protein translocase protein TatC